MEQVFASLSKRQTMLLLVSLAFGGSDAVEAFEHLAPDEEELLKYRAQVLLQIPREKRVPVLAQEIKRLVMQRRKQLGTSDPMQLAKALERERPQLVNFVLAALPGELATAVRAQLPQQIPLELKGEMNPRLLAIVRWKLEALLKKKGHQVGAFRFTDVMTLQARDLLAVSDRMGARVLATALAGLPDADREAFLQRLPPDQRVLASKAAEAGRARRLSPEDSQTVMDMHGANENPSQGLRSAGVQRFARACVAQSPDFAQRVQARHNTSELGRLMAKWLREEKNRPVKGDGGRMDIVEQLERLAQRGVVDRPMRLPPPVQMSVPPRMDPPKSAQRAATSRPDASRSVVQPLPRRLEPSRTDAPRDEAQRTGAPKRDFMAERAAMWAGVGRAAPIESSESPPPQARKGAGVTPRALFNAARPPASKATIRKAAHAPVTQEVPKRKERTQTKKRDGES